MHSTIQDGLGSAEARTNLHKIAIADERLVFTDFEISDPVPTGRQVIEEYTRGNPVDFIVLQWLPSGLLEELRLDEETDVRHTGVERFIVVKSDRSFRFEVEGDRQEWPASAITGATIKRLAGADIEEFEVLQARNDTPDLVIDDDDIINLAAEGVEKFRLRRRPRAIEIWVNEKTVPISRGVHTGLEIKQAAIDKGVAIQLDFVLSHEKVNGETRIIGDGDRIRVRPGDRFTAIADDDNS